MDEPQTPLSESAAARAADALGELRSRAQAVKTNRTGRLSQLESDITRQLDALAEMIAAQQASEAAATSGADDTRRELAELSAKLDIQDRELRKKSDRLDEFDQQLKTRETAVDQRTAEFVQRDEELTQRLQELDLREHALDRRDQAAESSESQLATEAREAGERADKFEAKCAELEREQNKLAEKVTRLQGESQTQCEAQAQAANDWQAERDELTATIATHEAAAEEWKARASATTSDQQKQTDKLKAALAESGEKLTATEQATVAATTERDELQQKFRLAHEDVQRFRNRVAELEQELARRPTADQTDTTELVALRAERDALAERVEALENQPAPPIDSSAAQHLADLQRRFELAVEDVRELKNKNAQLEGKLTAAKSHSGGKASDAGGMDWESQKRRMLASLEDEGGAGEIEPERQKERMSISDTISITDAVIAEKDEEINHLKKQLAAAPAASSPQTDDEARQAVVDELVENDEIIRQHRENIAQHELELEDKLRAAELEVSVERAKLARQRVELEQLKSDIDAARKAMPAGAVAVAPQVPKKRWLSKLGLGDEQ